MSDQGLWSSYALIVVDVQKDFFSAIPAVQESFPNFDQRVRRLISFARDTGIDVIHVRAVYEPDISISPWTKYWAELNPDKKTKVVETPEEFAVELSNEKVVIKHTFDGFLNTDLDSYLKSQGKQYLVICGLVTSCCVLFTTSGAFLRGYRTVVVKDCCGDRTVEKHDNVFNVYGAYMFRTTSVETISDDLKRWHLSEDEAKKPPPTL